VDISPEFNTTVHIPITTIASGAAERSWAEAMRTKLMTSLVSQPLWCANQPVAVTPQIASKTKPITLNVNFGLGMWHEMLIFFSTFANKAMAKN